MSSPQAKHRPVASVEWRDSPLDPGSIGMEARAAPGDHLALRLWLRLFSCSTQIQTEIRRRLRQRFDITLARFDYMAQLHRHREGLRMNMLSRYLMVTGGSITGMTDELEREGLVQRETVPGDRRAYTVSLTDAGLASFERIAKEHEAWIVELFSDLQPAERETLHALLGSLRVGMVDRQANKLRVAERRASSVEASSAGAPSAGASSARAPSAHARSAGARGARAGRAISAEHHGHARAFAKGENDDG